MKSSTALKKQPIAKLDKDKDDLRNLWNRLEAKGLLQNKEASLSFRLPGKHSFLLMDKKEGKTSKIKTKEFPILNPLESLDLDSIDDERRKTICFHASMYKHRPDIGAIAVFQSPWGSLLKTLKNPLPLVFDEQCRQLGAPILPLERTFDGSVLPNSVLLSGANGFLEGDGVVVTSVTREKAIYNCELIEKCSKAYLLAFATGGEIRRIPWFVRFIAKNRLLKDERRARESYERGETPTGFKAY
ncbi:class II aldolase/adducin family protein [Leptospira sp. 96542]|nr:class II aldolase/adducin family protein [Leptospira sp. 96542]